jgi:hypothetical protein
MLKRTLIDRTMLPAALLPAAKAHARVESDVIRDDDQIKAMIARAIDAFERLNEFHVNPAVWTWSPMGVWMSFPDGSSGWRIPVQPVLTFGATDADLVDVADQFTIAEGGDPDQFALCFMLATTPGATEPAGVTFTLNVGYSDPASLPPGIADGVMNATAWLYENRETAAMSGVDLFPTINRFFTGYWVPRA